MSARALMLVLYTLAMTTTTGALDIQLEFSASVSNANKASVIQAAQMWEHELHDYMTVRIYVNADPKASGLAGGSTQALATYPYPKVRGALIADAGYYWSWAEKEAAVMKALPASSVPVEVPDMPQFMPTGKARVEQAKFVTMTTANAKALGLLAADAKVLPVDPKFSHPKNAKGQYVDGLLLYDPSTGISTATAAHEIGHILGFVSHAGMLLDFSLGNKYPTTLDLWRFKEAETGPLLTHQIGSETRRLIPGPAEYYDTVLNNLSMARGLTGLDGKPLIDPYCYSMAHPPGQRCQASHWRDNLSLLMVPTGGTSITGEDLHAFDYIGYTDVLAVHPEVAKAIYRETVFGWMWDIAMWTDFEWTSASPPPPAPESITPPFRPDCAMVVRIGFSAEGLENRSGLGYARFVDDRENPYDPVHIPGDPEGARVDLLPAALLDLYFESDTEGVPFTGTALLPVSGAPWDSTLGEFGGYVVTLALDGSRDGLKGDIDAIATIALLADEWKLPNPDARNSFRIAPDYRQNKLVVYDPRALGIVDPYCPILDTEDTVDFGDFAQLSLGWRSTEPNLPGDLNHDAVVDFRDLGLLTAYWLSDCRRP